jgi:phosphoglycolate phosphatase
LESLGSPVPEAAQLLWCIGPPLQQSFAQLLDQARAPKAVELYRERFADIGLYENSVYPDIPLVLKTLQQTGATLHVASSKPHVYVNRILEHFQLAQFFERVFGAELDGTRSDKTTLLQYALEQTECSAENTTMIGDRHHDCTGALNNQMRFIGVLYGYGNAEELRTAGAHWLIEQPQQLVEFCTPGFSG